MKKSLFNIIVLDTSALVRFFTNDIPLKSSQVKKLIDSNKKLLIPDVVFPELEYVLRGKIYNASREEILKAFQYIVSRKNIVVSQEIIQAVELYEKTNLDIADCIIATSSFGHQLLSFDTKLLSVDGVEKV